MALLYLPLNFAKIIFHGIITHNRNNINDEANGIYYITFVKGKLCTLFRNDLLIEHFKCRPKTKYKNIGMKNNS